jgi:hypothetical protein
MGEKPAVLLLMFFGFSVCFCGAKHLELASGERPVDL